MHVLIFAIIFTGATLLCSDKHTNKIPPRLGETKEKSKSHDSLPQKKALDAPSSKETSDPEVLILTRTKSLNRISAKQKLSKAASSEDLTARIQARSTAKKSPTIVRFNDRPATAFYKKRPDKTKQIVRKEQKPTATQIKQIEEQIQIPDTYERMKQRSEFFRDYPDILAKIEVGIEKKRREFGSTMGSDSQ